MEIRKAYKLLWHLFVHLDKMISSKNVSNINHRPNRGGGYHPLKNTIVFIFFHLLGTYN